MVGKNTEQASPETPAADALLDTQWLVKCHRTYAVVDAVDHRAVLVQVIPDLESDPTEFRVIMPDGHEYSLTAEELQLIARVFREATGTEPLC